MPHPVLSLTKTGAHGGPHDILFLLRNVLAAPRLMYLLRMAPCTDSPVLPQYDAVLL